MHLRVKAEPIGRKSDGGCLPLPFVSRRQAGFTLLELMVSIAILGIIVLIMTAAMRLGFRSVEVGEKKIESLERTRTSLNVIEYQIQSFIPVIFEDNGTKKYSFAGDRTSLEITTNYSIWAGQRGYVQVSYRVETERSGKKTLYATETIVGLESSWETALLKEYADISFEYFHKDPTEEVGSWTERWTDEANIPEKVRLHLVSGKKDLSILIPMRARGSQTLTTTPLGAPTEG